ncbi:MAG TPA: RIP metalloprotease RseP [Clostridia bacterium]|jgi:regulator of sigma E protease|nr:RIP metalloprotease RseP [Clostridia bacterium]
MTILLTILILGILIFAHELGHFVVAKLVGIKVHEFALGMGPLLVSKKVGETTYSLRALPIGGFNRMAGMEPGEGDDPKGFNKKTVGQRMGVIAAGSLMNFVLAVIFFIIVFMGIGIASNSNLIAGVIEGSPAHQAGLKPGDRLVAIDEKPTPTWMDLTGVIRSSPEQDLKITVERGKERFQVVLRTELDMQERVGMIGIKRHFEKTGLFASIKMGITYSLAIIIAIVKDLVKIITGQVAADVAGPVGIVQLVGEAAGFGWATLINFAGILSLNLGLINLFPIPALDGSRLIFLGIEGIRGRPINPENENFIHFVGFALLIALMLLITYKDILRIIQ